MGHAAYESEMDMCKIYARVTIGVRVSNNDTISYSEVLLGLPFFITILTI